MKKLLENKYVFYIICFFIFYPKFFDYKYGAIIMPIIKLAPFTLFILIIVLMLPGKKCIYPLIWWVLLYRSIFLISNIINKSDSDTYVEWAKVTIWIIAVIVYFSTLVIEKKSVCINWLRKFMFFMILVQVITQIVLPNGIASMSNGVWSDGIGFIDVDNRLALFYILAVYIDGIYQIKKYNAIKKYTMLLMCTLSLVVAWSGSGLCAIAILIIYYLFSNRRYVQKIVSGYWIFLVYILFVLMFVVIQWITPFSNIIVNVLHKDLTLGNRTAIWLYYIAMILKQPFWGYGTETNGVYYSNWMGEWYAHDQVLDICVQGGIIALIVFALLIVYVKNKVNKNNSYAIIGLNSICILAYLIIGIVEHFLINYNVCFWAYLSISYAICFLFGRNDNHTRKKRVKIKWK